MCRQRTIKPLAHAQVDGALILVAIAAIFVKAVQIGSTVLPAVPGAPHWHTHVHCLLHSPGGWTCVIEGVRTTGHILADRANTRSFVHHPVSLAQHSSTRRQVAAA